MTSLILFLFQIYGTPDFIQRGNTTFPIEVAVSGKPIVTSGMPDVNI